jgi:peptidoglycan/LPS O-acetylase OafA/YrhL
VADTPVVERWPALDGVRALAVISVFLLHNHIWLSLHNGGYGVVIFFVLSGFLITTVLLREHHRSGTIRLFRFWSRRLARLYPALVVMVATSATYAALSHRADLPGYRHLDTAVNIGRSVVPPLFYVTNLFLPQHHYFGGHVHTWSLAVEEQFYVVLPIVLVVILKRRHAREWVLYGAATLAIGCQVWRFLLYRYAYTDHVMDASRWWYPRYVRVLIDVDGSDALLWGVLLAAIIWYAVSHSRVVEAISHLAPMGFGYVAWVIILAPRQVYGSMYLPNVAFAAACAVLIGGLVLRPSQPLARMLGTSPLVWMGKLSYSFYLWHFLIIRAFISNTQFGLAPPAVTLLRFLLSLGAASVSYFLVEQPFRAWFNARQAIPAAWPAPVPVAAATRKP